MKAQYVQYLEERGYIREWKNMPYLYVRKEGQVCYCVMLVDEISSLTVLEQKRKEIQMSYEVLGLSVRHLCILCQKNAMFSQEILTMVGQEANLWLLANDQNRVFCYEHQPEEFDGLKQGLEALPLREFFGFFRYVTWKNAPWVTLGLILINLLCFVIPVATGRYGDFLRFGKNLYSLTLGQGEYWRLITHMFLHGDFNHLWSNMLMLGILGLYVEPAIGHTQFTLIYFLSGVMAGIWSLISNVDSFGSIGASGAVYGILGVLLAMVLVCKKDYKGKLPNLSPGWVAFLCVASLVNGFFEIRVDNAAHFGGIIAGFFLLILTNKIRKICT